MRADRRALRRERHHGAALATTHELKTQPARYARRDGPRPDAAVRECGRHGWTRVRPRRGDRQYRCARCNTEAVTSSGASRRSSSPRPVAMPARAASTATSARCSSIISIPRPRRSSSAAQDHAFARPAARGGAEVRATVRELPREGRGRGAALCRAGRSSRVVQLQNPSGVAQWQSIRLLTEGLWVRVPPPELHEAPRGASFRCGVPSDPPDPRPAAFFGEWLPAAGAGAGRRLWRRRDDAGAGGPGLRGDGCRSPGARGSGDSARAARGLRPGGAVRRRCRAALAASRRRSGRRRWRACGGALQPDARVVVLEWAVERLDDSVWKWLAQHGLEDHGHQRRRT